MNQRYFRCLADDATYDGMRLSLDAAWGHAPPKTCIDPAAIAPRDASGRIVLAVWDSFCEFAAVADILPQLLADGAVEEIDADSYAAAIGKTP